MKTNLNALEYLECKCSCCFRWYGDWTPFLNTSLENNNKKSKYLDTIYDILLWYKDNKDHTKIFDYHKTIGQRVTDICIFGDIKSREQQVICVI